MTGQFRIGAERFVLKVHSFYLEDRKLRSFPTSLHLTLPLSLYLSLSLSPLFVFQPHIHVTIVLITKYWRFPLHVCVPIMANMRIPYQSQCTLYMYMYSLVYNVTYFQTMAFSPLLYLAFPFSVIILTPEVLGGTGIRTSIFCAVRAALNNDLRTS